MAIWNASQGLVGVGFRLERVLHIDGRLLRGLCLIEPVVDEVPPGLVSSSVGCVLRRSLLV